MFGPTTRCRPYPGDVILPGSGWRFRSSRWETLANPSNGVVMMRTYTWSVDIAFVVSVSDCHVVNSPTGSYRAYVIADGFMGEGWLVPRESSS